MSKICSSDIDYAKRGNSEQTSVCTIRCRQRMLGLVSGSVVLLAALVVTRLYSLQIEDYRKWNGRAVRQHLSEIQIAAERGPIRDREGKLLAVSVPAGSVYVRPAKVENIVEARDKLASLLEISPTIVEEKLKSTKNFVWVKRQIPKFSADRVESLKLPGVGYVLESKRYYPHNHSASTVIGRVGVDGTGLSGIEALHDSYLQSAEVTAPVQRDALGKLISVSNKTFSPPKGEALSLTLDAELQMIVDEELVRGRKDANSKAAMAVMVDADTGEILAMSQVPGINLNDAVVGSKDALKNRLVETIYEPGSTLKPIVAAIALEEGVAQASELIDCEDGSYRVGRHTVNDVHGEELISFHDVVVRSSNIGMTKVGMRMDQVDFHSALKKFGFGSPTGLGLPGETAGILRSHKRWAKIDSATHSFGQGIAVTPLQMVRAVSAITNGGYLPKLNLVMGRVPIKGERVLSTKTTKAVRKMMLSVVEDEHGTGKRAAIPGVRIGGKTGTAQKAREDARGYAEGKYIASFVGFVDARDIGVARKITLMVVVDEPDTDSIYGGTLAAPVFRRIIERSLEHLRTREELREALSA